MVKDESKKIERIKKQKRFKVLTPDIQKIWKSIVDNYELIEGAQLSNSFIMLMTLGHKSERISDIDLILRNISYNILGHIYKPASTLKDSLKIVEKEKDMLKARLKIINHIIK